MSGYMFDCECPRCKTKTVIFAGKYDTVEPDQCAVCAERGEAVNIKVVSVLVNVDEPDDEEEPDV